MKIKWPFVIIGMLAGWIVAEEIGKHRVPESTCVEMREEILAFQQCLKYRPSCKIGGPESFARYHKIKDLVQYVCPKSGDD